jgi:predicted nucleotidyltransferase
VLKLKNSLIAYAGDFVSFMIERTDVSKVKRIILFGSVARGEESDESDIDIFVDVFSNEKSVELEIKKIALDFIKSLKYEKYWFLKNIRNEIKVKVGKLDSWKELKNSIISNGIVLYGKFEEMPKKAVNRTLLYWENVKPESKRVLLSKRLFGYKKGRKAYEGLVQKYDGKKISKGLISVPSINEKVFLKLFRDMNVTVKIKNIIEY